MIDDLWTLFRIESKLASGLLREVRRTPERPAKAPGCAGGVFFMTNIVRARDGSQMGVMSVNRCADGPHRRPKATKLGDLTLYRTGHQGRPER